MGTNFMDSGTIWGIIIFLVLLVGIIVLVRWRWLGVFTAVTGSVVRKRKDIQVVESTPAKPETKPVASTSVTKSKTGYGWVFPLILLAGAAFCIWYAYGHWREWFPKTVQCTLMSEAHQDCTMGPGAEAMLPAPHADPDRNLQICLILGSGKPGEFQVWYMDNTGNTKKSYNPAAPPQNVTSYWFKAGPEGGTITYYLAENSC